MAKLRLTIAALVAVIGAYATTPASAQSSQQVCPQDWTKCSPAQKLEVAKVTCGRNLTEQDYAQMGLGPLSREDFLVKLQCIPERSAAPQQRVVNGVVVPEEDDDTVTPTPVQYRRGPGRPMPQGYGTFENVAADSLRVHTNSRGDFGLRNLRGSPELCQAPRRWHRTETCRPLPGGGITCKMACR